jgi:predicted kinase
VPPILLAFSGLPGTGKTAIAWELARRLDGVYLRIDSIEQAIRDSGVVAGPPDDAGYRVGYAVAADNLRLGLNVIADCVNPLNITREAWAAVAAQVGAIAVNVEIVCSNVQEHRRRVETRVADIPGLNLPTWDEVVARDYQTWVSKRIVIDTAGRSAKDTVEELRKALATLCPQILVSE